MRRLQEGRKKTSLRLKNIICILAFSAAMCFVLCACRESPALEGAYTVNFDNDEVEELSTTQDNTAQNDLIDKVESDIIIQEQQNESVASIFNDITAVNTGDDTKIVYDINGDTTVVRRGGHNSISADDDIAESIDNTEDADELPEEEAKENEAEKDNEEMDDSYTYTDKNEKFIADANLNIRSGPYIDFDVIGSYNRGETVAVTGVCNETGWSRVDNDGTIGYVDSNYLAEYSEQTSNNNTESNNSNNDVTTDNNGTSNSESNSNDSSGNNTSNGSQEEAPSYNTNGLGIYNFGYLNGQYIGRLTIPSVGVDVALYNSNSQRTVDNTDSAGFWAAWCPPDANHDTVYCADHNYQGFEAIKNCSVGTYLYIECVDGNTYRYVCDSVDYSGHNDTVYIYTHDWIPCYTYSGLWLYTCNANSSSSITLLHFHAG